MPARRSADGGVLFVRHAFPTAYRQLHSILRPGLMIHVIATIELRDGSRDEFLQEFHRLIPLVRDEDGCVEYGPAVDLATSNSEPPRANVVTVIEKWSSVEALDAHLKAPHMSRYRDIVKDIVVSTKVQVLEPA